MSTIFINSQSTTGTCLLTQAGAAGVTWNLTSLEVSLSGSGYAGPGAKLTIYDGTVGGTVLFMDYLTLPVGSVGTVQKINLPVDAHGFLGLQALTGNAMNILVNGVGNNFVSINARFTDGLP
jgi:hypothetical protein